MQPPFIPHTTQEFPGIPLQSLLAKYSIRTVAFTGIHWQSRPIGALVVVNSGGPACWMPMMPPSAGPGGRDRPGHCQCPPAGRFRRRLNRLEALRTIDSAINASLDLHHTLAVFLNQLRDQLHMDTANILLFSQHSLTLEHASSAGMRTDALESVHVPLRGDPAGQVVLERQRLSSRSARRRTGPRHSPWKATYVSASAYYQGTGPRGALDLPPLVQSP